MLLVMMPMFIMSLAVCTHLLSPPLPLLLLFSIHLLPPVPVSMFSRYFLFFQSLFLWLVPVLVVRLSISMLLASFTPLLPHWWRGRRRWGNGGRERGRDNRLHISWSEGRSRRAVYNLKNINTHHNVFKTK